MTIKLYNTKTKSKDVFEPLDKNNVRMYVCGPTVYDRAHLGNARPVVVFDTLFRLLRHTYGADRVTYVRNFTDVDDKINARAIENVGPDADLIKEVARVTDETIGWYHDDMDALGALRPQSGPQPDLDCEPRATKYIDKMVDMIKILIDRKHAYPDGAGHVLFAVRSYDEYGALARRSLDDMRAGARVEVADNKRDPMDFVLWKPSSEDQPGWDSPWGKGRPGWHIECSAMAYELLGESFDIHGGGIDLAFPHHENEVAQSKCSHPEGDFARFWLHNEMLQVEGKKMSKSLGNFFTVRDLLDMGVSGDVIRLVFLQSHYSKPMGWDREIAEIAERELAEWHKLCDGVDPSPKVPVPVVDAISDDLNSPKVITEFRRLASEGKAAELLASANMLGLLQGTRTELENDIEAQLLIEKLKVLRAKSREEKDFSTSDAVRDAFMEAGVAMRDTPAGTICSIEKGVLDTWPFHEAFRAAMRQGDEAGIDVARNTAALAGVHFAKDATADSSIAWVSAPSSKHVIKILRVLEKLS